nr:short chain dehydrogenase [uncultured Deefgea sp.]
MKIIVIGAAGTIGQALVKELASRHEIISAGRNSGDIQVDLTDAVSIEKMYQQVGPVDAVISAAGNVHFGALNEMTAAEYAIGINDKLMWQVQLVLIGQKYLNDGGSFTLVSGVLAQDPIVYGSSASMVNAGIEGFARAAAIELPRGLRINVVSPTVVTE